MSELYTSPAESNATYEEIKEHIEGDTADSSIWRR